MPRLPADPLRVIVERVTPLVDGGRFPAKASLGEPFVVEADAFSDGHSLVHVDLLHRMDPDDPWDVVAMEPIGNDRWAGEIPLRRCGRLRYTVVGWHDHYGSWVRDTHAIVQAGADTELQLREGAEMVATAETAALGSGHTDAAARLRSVAAALRSGDTSPLDDPSVADLMRAFGDRSLAAGAEREFTAEVERERARVGAWYELFPRSCATEPGRHGTLRDCADHLAYVASMGFDVVYLPPIHPIGRTARKGRNNSVSAQPGDVGSPWAIGGVEGGHTAIHPDLGTLDDFDDFVERATSLGLEPAMDLAFQCSPDHPWVTEHPSWFRHRVDGTIRCAENPPKRYEDIYPLDFESDDWQGLWEALFDVTRFWIDRGVRIFRVDNPHTKPFRFWQWLIARVRDEHPDVVFLAEAFTRPKVMYQLAKCGFSQSYTYFTWRRTAHELRQYFDELRDPEIAAFFRPNLWPNTPDILTEELQFGGRPAATVRFVLAATLGPSYGIYGPAFELGEHVARPGAEEYLDNEKYQLRTWDVGAPHSLRPLITRLNRIRRENDAFSTLSTLRFHHCDNDQLLCFSKTPVGGDDPGNGGVVVVVNLDPHHVQSGSVELDLEAFGLGPDEQYQAHDLVAESRFLWRGSRNFVSLDPRTLPVHVLRIRRRTRTENDFEYFT